VAKYSVYLGTYLEVEVSADDPKAAALAARFQVLQNMLQHLPPRFRSVGFDPANSFQVRPIISSTPGIRNLGEVILRGEDKDLDPR
jgi:hypothetical protein